MTHAEVRQTLRLHEKEGGEDEGPNGGMGGKAGSRGVGGPKPKPTPKANPKPKPKLSAKALTTAPYLLLYTRETEREKQGSGLLSCE